MKRVNGSCYTLDYETDSVKGVGTEPWDEIYKDLEKENNDKKSINLKAFFISLIHFFKSF